MTRPLVHLREQVRSERCSWGVINMENGREDRLRLGEEDEPGRRSGGRKRRTSGRQTAIRRERTRQQKKHRVMMRLFLCLLIFLLGAGTGWTLRGKMIRKLIDPSTIEMPNWVDEQLLTVNRYSRPETNIPVINGIVIHYVANPGTTAQQNHDYFEGLKDQSGSNTVSVSSNFVIGLDGEIIECVPVGEKAYASNERNADTVSIECCHPAVDGKFTDETYDSLVKLTAWLCKQLDLSPKDVIRHYDVTGKACPKYFVDHEDAWKQFRKDVKKAMRKDISDER